MMVMILMRTAKPICTLILTAAKNYASEVYAVERKQFSIIPDKRIREKLIDQIVNSFRWRALGDDFTRPDAITQTFWHRDCQFFGLICSPVIVME